MGTASPDGILDRWDSFHERDAGHVGALQILRDAGKTAREIERFKLSVARFGFPYALPPRFKAKIFLPKEQ